MYRLIACDLDQTLLSDDRSVSDLNTKAITKLKELGIKFVIATGRGFQSVQTVLTDIDLNDKPDEYVISLNGAIITENHRNRIISFTPIAEESIEHLLAYGADQKLDMHVYTQDDVYVINLRQADKEYLDKRIEYNEIQQTQLTKIKKTPIAKIIYYYSSEAQKQQIITDINPITQDKVAVSFSSGHYVELNHLSVDKGSGLIKLAALLNIPLSQTMAIGDNFNDLSMITVAGLGISVGNGQEAIKKIADYVCVADNNQDAISEVLERFIYQR